MKDKKCYRLVCTHSKDKVIRGDKLPQSTKTVTRDTEKLDLRWVKFSRWMYLKMSWVPLAKSFQQKNIVTLELKTRVFVFSSAAVPYPQLLPFPVVGCGRYLFQYLFSRESFQAEGIEISQSVALFLSVRDKNAAHFSLKYLFCFAADLFSTF